MYSYSRRQTSSLALPHQPSRPPRYDQYEISGLTRIYHTNLLRKTESSFYNYWKVLHPCSSIIKASYPTMLISMYRVTQAVLFVQQHRDGR